MLGRISVNLLKTPLTTLILKIAMKKNVILMAGLFALVLGACKTSELTSFDDDIYRNPAEEQQLARARAEAEAKKEAEARAKASQEEMARKEAEANNPYYQDPKENADDYYDYKYASRLNRFSSPIAGAGYYDSRYTNYYTYNQNPMMYGSSIYSSYNWMPSSQFSNYSMGISMGFGSGYNSFGYSPYYGSTFYGSYGYPYNSFGYGYGMGYPYYSYNSFGYYDPFYSGYNAGYYNGFYNGYNSGWGYYNSFDANSGYSQMLNAPRGSNGGGNSGDNRGSLGARPAQGESARAQFMESMAEKQRNTPRFTESGNRPARSNNSQGSFNNGESPSMGSSRNNRNVDPSQTVNPNTNGTANQQQNRSSGNRERIMESQPQQNSNNSSPANGSRSSGGSNSSGGGSSSPRNSGGGGGGGNRPR